MTLNLTDVFFILCWIIGLGLVSMFLIAVFRALRRF